MKKYGRKIRKRKIKFNIKRKRKTKSTIIQKIILLFLLLIINIFLYIFQSTRKKKKIGVISVRHEVNVGNNLLKYAISEILKRFGFIPYIVATHWKNYNITFINETTNLVIIKDNFSEIKENDYDILLVNSDQTWAKFDNHFYDYAFLKFAENWNIPRFAYAASSGDNWQLRHPKDKNIAKNLLEKFSGLSVREKNIVKILKDNFGLNSTFVLDPTLLLDKRDYLRLIKNYRSNISINENYVFSYLISQNGHMLDFVKKIALKLNYNVNFFFLNNDTSILEFLYLISNCKAVITNSYHGTIFSIIFNKPFVTLAGPNGNRFASLEEIFEIKSRIRMMRFNPDNLYINLLNQPLNLNKTLFNLLKEKSLHFLKRNLQKFK